MTLVAPPAIDLRRRRSWPIWLGAGITAAFAAAGTVVATAILPTFQTPADVAKAYAEARFARDWSTAWALLCEPERAAIGDYQTYADSAPEALRSMPGDVDVSTGRMERVYGSAMAVPVTVTSREHKDWEVKSHVVLVLEDSRLRVCDNSLLPF
jgi:hypothetical protein